MREWLQGKKTYIGAALMVVCAAVGWWMGIVNGANTLSVFAAAFSVAGLGAKANRYGELTLTALEEVKRVANLKSSGQKIDPSEIAALVTKGLARAQQKQG